MATQSFRQSDGPFDPPAPTIAIAGSADTDAQRRTKLAASDDLLGEIEELCLRDRRALPIQLGDRIRDLHVAVRGFRSGAKLKTCHAAHDFVFALQEPLLVANPRNTVSRPSHHRVPGQPMNVETPIGGTWKVLSLRAEPEAGLTEEWFALVAETIERAWQRWDYAQHHAIAAARRRRRSSRQAAARAIVAWSNYWQLLEEADRLRGVADPPPG